MYYKNSLILKNLVLIFQNLFRTIRKLTNKCKVHATLYRKQILFNMGIIILNLFILFISLTLCIKSYAQTHKNNLTIKSLIVNDKPLSEIISFLANKLKKNIIISPNITKYISLSLHNISLKNAYNNLLATQDLVEYNKNNATYIINKKKYLKRQQDEFNFNKELQRTTLLKTIIIKLHYINVNTITNWINNKNNNLVSTRGSIHIDKRSNQLIIKDTKNNLNQIISLIHRIDIPMQQVLIEARIASIDNIAEQKLGIELSTSKHIKPQFTSTSHEINYHKLNIIHLINYTLLDASLSAIEKQGHGEIISSPKLFTSNLQTAFIESGEEIPYQEISKSGATGVSFRKAVLSLKVTPQILPQNKVLLSLQINQDKPTARIIQGVPSITTRKINTNILVKNGQTIVLGGIYENSKNKIKSSIPFLGKIPFLGVLFQKLTRIKDKRELVIFVTPWIIKSP